MRMLRFSYKTFRVKFDHRAPRRKLEIQPYSDLYFYIFGGGIFIVVGTLLEMHCAKYVLVTQDYFAEDVRYSVTKLVFYFALIYLRPRREPAGSKTLNFSTPGKTDKILV